MSIPLTGDRHFRNQLVRLSELTVNSSSLDGLEFSNCRVVGPAVLAFLGGVTVTGCTWDTPSLEAMFWIVEPPRDVVGAVGVADCVFSNCRFQDVGVAGTRELFESFVAGFTPG